MTLYWRRPRASDLASRSSRPPDGEWLMDISHVGCVSSITVSEMPLKTPMEKPTT